MEFNKKKIPPSLTALVVLTLIFAGCIGIPPTTETSISKEMIKPNDMDIPSSTMYGCPGCPSNFMDFAKDMCNRMGSTYTVSDGTNTLKCSELVGGT
jgi:hypothetical protein